MDYYGWGRTFLDIWGAIVSNIYGWIYYSIRPWGNPHSYWVALVSNYHSLRNHVWNLGVGFYNDAVHVAWDIERTLRGLISTARDLAYEALGHLGWNIRYGGHTAVSWGRYMRDKAKEYADIIIDAVRYTANRALNNIGSRIVNGYWTAESWAEAMRDMVWGWAKARFDDAKAKALSAWNWVQGAGEVLKGWYDIVSSEINHYTDVLAGYLKWLKNNAKGMIEYLYNDLFPWLKNLYISHGGNLINFLVDCVTYYYNLWSDGATILSIFISDPQQAILDWIAEPFVDWVMQVIADRW